MQSNLLSRPLALTVLLASLTALTALSIDMSLPAMPQMQETFRASAAMVQLTLSLFLLGYAGGQLISGPLSDQWGRRRVLLIGVAIFTLAGAACALCHSLPLLIACRFVQGFGASVGPILARAMVSDCFATSEAVGVLSQMTQVMMIAPLVAPTFGGFLLVHVGWPAIFVTLTICGAIVGITCLISLPETIKQRHPSGDALQRVATGLRDVVTHAPSLRNVLITVVCYGGLMAFVSGSPFVYIDVFHVSKQHFGIFFAMTAAALMVSASLNRQLSKRHAGPVMLGWGVWILAVSGVLLAVLVHLRIGGIYGVLIPMMAFLFGIGLTTPNAVAGAMAAHGKAAGLTSSLIGCLQTGAGALGGYLVGRFFDNTAGSLAGAVAVSGLSALALACWRVREERVVMSDEDAVVSEMLAVEEV